MRIRTLALALAIAAGGIGQAMAGTVFSNDFSAGIGASEAVFGNFSVANGTVGTQGSYPNNAVGGYGFSANLQGYTQATLTYSYSVNTEPCCDFLTVYAAKSPFELVGVPEIASYKGYQNGTATLDLTPFIGPTTAVLFRFTSDGSVTGAGVSIGNVALAGSGGVGVPGPVAGAGLPMLALAGIAWMLRRRSAKAA